MKILNKINSPEDVKKLSLEEMKELSRDIREAILFRVNNHGGHLGPDLGIVETTIAMHYVFDSPKDKFVFDISHQVYPHKMLTGRKEGFINKNKMDEINGYSNPYESEHDFFTIGHTSTSISLATGMAKARDLKGEKENVIALIGDGSLSGGEAFEGLNNASVLNSNFIVIVNDNEMSIAENQGGLYSNLKLLRESNGESELNFFKSFGFDYYYVEEGHNVGVLIETLQKVKNSTSPVVVHIHTTKGKGLPMAEANKETYHWSMPGFLDKKEDAISTIIEENYSSITADYILKKKEKDSTVVAITPATPGISGFTPEFRKKMGANYVDVAIAEEHGIAFSSGLAKNGAKPICAVLSTFVQRTYDQISQDLALNNSPATILVFYGSISSMSDATHLCWFDIPMMSNIPNLVYLSPTSKEEYLSMLDWSVEQNDHSVAIRVPFGPLISTGIEDKTNYSILNKFKIEEEGDSLAIVGLGNFLSLAKEVKKELKSKFNINATVINPKFITGIDKELLESLKKNHKLVITLEDGCLEGGFGEKISRFYGDSEMKVLNFGAGKEFADGISIQEMFKKCHLTKELIVEDIMKIIK